MISANIKAMRENSGLSQAALAKKLGVSRTNVNAWEIELSNSTAYYLIEMAKIFSYDNGFHFGNTGPGTIVLRNMNQEEKQLIYGLVNYISGTKENN